MRPALLLLAAQLLSLGCATVPSADLHAAEEGGGMRALAQRAAAELAETMLSSPYFVKDRSRAPWAIGYWQEANLCETFANFLLANASDSVRAINDGHDHHAAALQQQVVGALERSFEHYPAEWLISNEPEKDSYDDLLWWALAYLRAHELCTARPDILSCTIRLPRVKRQSCTCAPCGSSTPHNYTTPGSQCSPATEVCSATSGPPSKSTGTCYTDCVASCDCVHSNCTVQFPGAGAQTTLLEQGKLIFDYVYNASWNTDYCQGGFAWSLTSQNYKNCVTNQLGILTASKLGRLLTVVGRGNEVCDCKAEQTYSAIAKVTAAWLQHAPMRNDSTKLYKNELYCSAHNVSAGRKTVCTGTNTPVWTYCQGLPIGFDVELHQLTGDTSHLDDAFVLASAVRELMTVPTKAAGGDTGMVLMESACATDQVCGWVHPPLPTSCKCDNNQMIFKGILSRYLGYLNTYAKTSRPGHAATVRAFLEDNINSVLANNKATSRGGTQQLGGYGLLWQGPVFGLVDANAGNLNQAVLDLLLAVSF